MKRNSHRSHKPCNSRFDSYFCNHIGESSNGRTADSDSAYLGSSPSSPARTDAQLGLHSLGENTSQQFIAVHHGKIAQRKSIANKMARVGGSSPSLPTICGLSGGSKLDDKSQTARVRGPVDYTRAECQADLHFQCKQFVNKNIVSLTCSVV